MRNAKTVITLVVFSIIIINSYFVTADTVEFVSGNSYVEFIDSSMIELPSHINQPSDALGTPSADAEATKESSRVTPEIKRMIYMLITGITLAVFAILLVVAVMRERQKKAINGK